MSKIDPYLIHAFEGVTEQVGYEVQEGSRGTPEAVLLPMLIRVTDLSWNPIVPDLIVLARMGNIVACLGSLRAVAILKDDPAVLSIEASRPASAPETSDSIPLVKADKVHSGLPEKGDEALIAIIDSDIDVLHSAFCYYQTIGDTRFKRTRIREIWDQTDPSGPGPQVSSRLNSSFGTVHTEADINSYLQSEIVPPVLAKVGNGHGTHVASIAAGTPLPASNFSGGIAPEAHIIVVKPRLEVGPTDPYSIGYSVNIVAALAYIDDIAEQLALPVVVNLSQGMNAGAHDGTSSVEASFDEFTKGGRKPGRVVVKSAGNQRSSDNHAYLNMANWQADTLEWYSPETHIGQDTIDLWFKACDEMRFRLRDPSDPARKSPQVDWFNPVVSGYFLRGNNYKITYDRYNRDNGDSCLTVTIQKGRGLAIERGLWTLEIEAGKISSPGNIHAWIERNDTSPIRFKNHTNQDVTVTIPGTANTVICVGSVTKSKPFSVSISSSQGPTRDRREKPDLTAPGEGIVAAEGGAISHEALKSSSGTSMAAPHVTGAIALLFSHWRKQRLRVPDWEQLNAAQIRAAISQTTQNYNGYWHQGIGFGVLDVEKLLHAFD